MNRSLDSCNHTESQTAHDTVLSLMGTTTLSEENRNLANCYQFNNKG